MEFEPTVSAVNMYTTYKSWWFTGILYVALGIILSLAIFEEPAADASFLPLTFYITVSRTLVCILGLIKCLSYSGHSRDSLCGLFHVPPSPWVSLQQEVSVLERCQAHYDHHYSGSHPHWYLHLHWPCRVWYQYSSLVKNSSASSDRKYSRR